MKTVFKYYEGHDMGVDYWSFGVTLFEMLTSQLPFEAYDQYELFKLIAKCKFDIPTDIVEEDAANLISKLVVKRKKRLGCLAGDIDDIREHAFFANVDWHEITNQNIKAPYIPKIEDKFDITMELAKETKPEKPSRQVNNLFHFF